MENHTYIHTYILSYICALIFSWLFLITNERFNHWKYLNNEVLVIKILYLSYFMCLKVFLGLIHFILSPKKLSYKLINELNITTTYYIIVF